MIRIISYTTLVATVLFATACYNDTEEELYGISVCNLESVTYADNVEPIVNNSCYACHSQKNAPSNGAGINLEGYDKLKIAVANGLLIESITHGLSASPMPKNSPKLSECKINTINTWIENGALNN